MPQYNKIYTYNWLRFAAWFLPYNLRQVTLFRYIVALLTPITEAYTDFLAFRKRQLYEAEINGQTIKLERVLNDTFDPIERRIYITDGDYYTPPVFMEEWKNQSVLFPAESANNKPIFYSINSITNTVSFNFYVHIPSTVWYDKVRVRALIIKYKIFGRLFDIVLID